MGSAVYNSRDQAFDLTWSKDRTFIAGRELFLTYSLSHIPSHGRNRLVRVGGSISITRGEVRTRKKIVSDLEHEFSAIFLSICFSPRFDARAKICESTA
jgi:hypothetical protein